MDTDAIIELCDSHIDEEDAADPAVYMLLKALAQRVKELEAQ